MLHVSRTTTLTLDVLVDALGGLEERLLHALARLGGRLEEGEAVLVGELFGLVERDVPLLVEVALVADEEDHGVGVGQVARVRQPRRQVVVGGAPPEQQTTEHMCATRGLTSCRKPLKRPQRRGSSSGSRRGTAPEHKY